LVDDETALVVGEAFGILPPETVHEADVSRLCQEGVVIDETPERNLSVDRSGVTVVTQNPTDPHHAVTSTSWRSCLAGSKRRRKRDEDSRICSMSGSRAVAHAAKP